MSFKLKFNCTENWDSMRSCGTRRFCQNCQKSVHDLALMSEADAIQTVQDSKPTCVRFSVNKSGQVLTQSGFSKALIFTSTLAIGCWDKTDEGTSNTSSNTTETVEVMMGDVEEDIPHHEVDTVSTEGNTASTSDKNEDCTDAAKGSGQDDTEQEEIHIHMGKPIQQDPEVTPPPTQN